MGGGDGGGGGGGGCGGNSSAFPERRASRSVKLGAVAKQTLLNLVAAHKSSRQEETGTCTMSSLYPSIYISIYIHTDFHQETHKKVYGCHVACPGGILPLVSGSARL